MSDPAWGGSGELTAEEARDYEGLFDRWAHFYRRAHRGQLLIRGSEVPHVVSRQGASRFYVMPQFEELSLLQWVVFVRYLKDVPNGRHRHQGGIALFALEGRGYSVVNEKRYDWEAGDVVLLPLVPGGLDHQHFPAVPGKTSTFMGIIFEPLIVGLGAEMTQLEPRGNPSASEGASTRAPRPPGEPPEPSPTLQGLVELHQWQLDNLSLPTLIEGAELPIDRSPLGELRWYLHPGREGFAGVSPILLFTVTLEAGRRSEELRGPGNGFAYVLEGEPTVRVDDEVLRCTPTDMVLIPARRDGVGVGFEAPEGGVRLLVALANLSGLGGVGLGTEFGIGSPRGDR